MGKPTGFLEYRRVRTSATARSPSGSRTCARSTVPLAERRARTSRRPAAWTAAFPSATASGCPVENRIPEFNDLVYRGQWREAAREPALDEQLPGDHRPGLSGPVRGRLHAGHQRRAGHIKHIEYQIAERAFAEGWVEPQRRRCETGKRVAVVGSGPAGLAAAQQLARAGHDVVVFEKDDRIGGLLRYGIPDFKLEKQVIDRRLEQMAAEGVKFEPGVEVGEDLSAALPAEERSTRSCSAMGAGEPRSLEVPGRRPRRRPLRHGLPGPAEPPRGRRPARRRPTDRISAKGKHVVVIGGGDTGSDCVGTSHPPGAGVGPPVGNPAEAARGHNPETPWPIGRRSCGPPPRTKRAASAAGAF